MSPDKVVRQLLLHPHPHDPDNATVGISVIIQWVFLPFRYLEIGAKCVQKRFACAIIVVTELERMSCICSKNLSKENRNIFFQTKPPKEWLSEILQHNPVLSYH